MRRLDNFDIKVMDASMLKYDIRKFLNECLDDLDARYSKVMAMECIDNSFNECRELYDDVVAIFEFMIQVKLINARTYQGFNKDFNEMMDQLQSKVEEKKEV